MDRREFYEVLDISDPSEFKYYENLAALLEEDRHVGSEQIADLLGEIDIAGFGDLLESFFDEFLRVIPDAETDLYVAVENIKRVLLGRLPLDGNEQDLADYAELLHRFRKWYVHDTNVIDLADGSDHSVRDARYEIIAAGLLGRTVRYDFRAAVDFDAGGYDMLVADMILRAGENEMTEGEEDADQNDLA